MLEERVVSNAQQGGARRPLRTRDRLATRHKFSNLESIEHDDYE